MLARTDSWKSTVSCETMPIIPRKLRSWNLRMSVPSIRILPEVTSKNRLSRSTRVLFPAPLGPTTATMVPRSTTSDTSSSTGLPSW